MRVHTENLHYVERLRISRKTGDRGGIRTHDHLIKSQVLYRLSYAVNMTEADRCDTIWIWRTAVKFFLWFKAVSRGQALEKRQEFA